MLNLEQALRLAFETSDGWGIPAAVSEVWGDADTFVIFIGPADSIINRPSHDRPLVVHRATGRLDEPEARQERDVLLQGLSRLPWSRYRPLEPNVSSTRIRKCPTCGGRLVPILWGMPGPELIEQSAQGLVALGGCVLPAPAEPHPLKACRECGWELFIEPNRPPA